jgi:catechol 1,2-dioxygenase
MARRNAKPPEDGGSPLIEGTDTVTPAVLAAMASTPNARLREIMQSLTAHLHRFLLETGLTEREYEEGLKFIAALGQNTHSTNNEVVLAADVLGLSTLVDSLNSGNERGQTASALLGPFYRANAPELAMGADLAQSGTPGPALFFNGQVRGATGNPIGNATLDVWHSSSTGLYENQDPAQESMNLRGRFRTGADGRYWFRTVKPKSYPVPTDGPVGKLLAAQNRHPFRPAHVHFIVSAPGHRTLITQVFSDTDEALAADVVFGAKRQLVCDFLRHDTADDARFPDAEPPFYSAEFDFVLVEGTPSFPTAPIP